MEIEKLKKTRGGARPGAGRKKTSGRDIQVSFLVSNLARENLKKYCAANGISQNEALTKILEGLITPD